MTSLMYHASGIMHESQVHSRLVLLLGYLFSGNLRKYSDSHQSLWGRAMCMLCEGLRSLQRSASTD